MVQWGKALAKTGDMSFIPGLHMVGGESRLDYCKLSSELHMLAGHGTQTTCYP